MLLHNLPNGLSFRTLGNNTLNYNRLAIHLYRWKAEIPEKYEIIIM